MHGTIPKHSLDLKEAEWNIYKNTFYKSINKKLVFFVVKVVKLLNIAYLEGEDRGLWKEEIWSTNQSIKRDINADNGSSTEIYDYFSPLHLMLKYI